jgi:hypothetical protein
VLLTCIWLAEKLEKSSFLNFIFKFSFLLIYSGTLWDKLEEVLPDSWDEFSDLFSRQPVQTKAIKPKTESNKPVKQQAIKSALSWNVPSILVSIGF